MTNPLETYLTKIEADLRHGKATEHTYRPALKVLLEALTTGAVASNDPKHVKCGAPDYIIERGQVPLGYVETKDVGEDLNKVEKSDQLKRYLPALHNLILTDYLEFRWYVNGARKLTTRLAAVGKGGKLTSDPAGIAKTAQLFTEFYQTEVPTVGTPKELAQRMAALTKITRDLITGSLREEGEGGVFHKQMEAFRQQLLPTLVPEEFADIYAQTMAYGLFAARINMPEGQKFSRAQAYIYLPPANPFLRKLFLDVGEELDGTPVAPFLDDLATLLDRADIPAIRKDFGKRTRTEDPVVHFYETFLAAYNPKLRKSRGVYYTPEPVVEYIVNSIHWLLKTYFNKTLGLADPEVLLLDPATGTATFPYYVIRRVHEMEMERGQGGMWKDYVREKLLPRLFGFELLMAPYAVAHLKLGLLLAELGYTFGKHERLGVYLTNTLEVAVAKTETLGLAGYLSEEGNAAAEVKSRKLIMVVFGNPPYEGRSKNPSQTPDGELTFIGQLLKDYSSIEGAPLKERNSKWRQNDYVKFIRFAQWRIEQTGHGVVGLITSNSYLDAPTLRGMRYSLLKTFDEIHILDLHGNSKKREHTPDGGRDVNVFDIQEGVAILLAVKSASHDGSKPRLADIYHANLWGEREAKYSFLENNDAGTVTWKKLSPTAPLYLFVPQNEDLRGEYDRGWDLTKAMPINVLGFQTHRDPIAVAFDPGILRKQVEAYLESPLAKQEWQLYCRACSYRPFDERVVYFDKRVTDRPRLDVMQHLFEPNMALNLVRQTKADTWQHALVSDKPTPAVFIEVKDGSSVFPLYSYTTSGSTSGPLFGETRLREPNFASAFVREFSEKVGLTFIRDGSGDLSNTFGPEDVFNYAYAILHSPTYRKRYSEYLKTDFPRLPITSDRRLFAKLVPLGAQLVELHLMKSPGLDTLVTTFPVSGSNEVENIHFEKKKVFINETQYFGGVPQAVWECMIGGYQVCDRWLKDRKGRQMSGEDIVHYQRIIVALKETLRVMKQIDAAIPTWPIG